MDLMGGGRAARSRGGFSGENQRSECGLEADPNRVAERLSGDAVAVKSRRGACPGCHSSYGVRSGSLLVYESLDGTSADIKRTRSNTEANWWNVI